MPDWLKRAQVSVEIAQYRSRSIFVLGEVRTPGRYSIEGPMTLLEVIANAGSTTPTASNTIIVQRYKDGIAAAVSAPALPGDARSARSDAHQPGRPARRPAVGEPAAAGQRHHHRAAGGAVLRQWIREDAGIVRVAIRA